MPYLTPEQILGILASRDFGGLVGIIEDDLVEAKGEPYRLTEPRAKLELAKDVSALANHSGGIIVIGLRTERSSVHMADEVMEVRRFSETLVNRDQYYDVLRRWVYPQLEGIGIQWYPSAEDPTRGLVAISIPKQPEREWPFLVTHTLDEGDRQVDIVFGYMERKRAGVEPMRVHDLRALLRDGRRFGELEGRFDEVSIGLKQVHDQLRSIVERPAAPAEAERREPPPPPPPPAAPPEVVPPPPPPPAVPPEVLSGRRNAALTEAGLQGQPMYFLAGVPRPAIELPTLFQERSELVRALNDPPALRPSGFSISVVGARARIVHGQLRRALDRERAALELWRDGTLLFVIEASDFLCWGTRVPGAPLRINPLALCESAYGFADMSRIVFGHADPGPQGVGYTLGLYKMTLGEQAAQLIPGPLGTMRMRFGMDIHTAPAPSNEFEVQWEGAVNPGAVAYRLVREVYRWFGIDDDEIPYTSETEGGRVIDPEAIRRAGS